VRRLLDAYAGYRKAAGRSAWGLVLVGSGHEEALLRDQAKELPEVVFAGFQQMDTLPVYYGLASCLVLPSVSESWGLVVNEAMAAGLPVLVSHHCGCVPELVKPGVNGYVFNPLDTGGLARLMGLMSSRSVDADKMGEASRRSVAVYTPETWAESIGDCIDRTVACKREKIQGKAPEWSGFSRREKQPS
jgi:glycosyltransferase involved in cell wall biosynthesis